MDDSAAHPFLLTRHPLCARDEAHEVRGPRRPHRKRPGGLLLLLDPAPLPEGRGIPAENWQQTPTGVQHQFLALLKQVDAREARLHRDSSNASRPPSTAAPSTKRTRRTKAVERRKSGAKPGHPGPHQVLLASTATVSLFPEGCSYGHRGLVEFHPYHTHQVMARPVIRPAVTHGLLPQGRCLSCGTRCKASLPSAQMSGYGPRLTGFVGEMAGIVGASRSAVQDLWTSVFGIPLSTGAIQKMVNRISAEILPHDTAIGEVTRVFLVHYSDETLWLS